MGIHSIDVIAVNNDKDWEGDQESISDMNWVDIIAAPTPPDDDDYPPVITIIHEGEATSEDPGFWNVYVGDTGSGLAEVKISVDGEIIIYDQQLLGIPFKSWEIDVPGSLGNHIIEVFAKDNDNDWPGDQQSITIVEDITIIPPIFG